MKKYLKLLIVIICMFIMVGCKSGKLISNKEDVISNLYSDENRIVYNNGGIDIIVYTFKNNKLTKLENYYEFDSEEEAKEHYDNNKSIVENNTIVTGIDLVDNVVIYTFSIESYKDMTMDDIRKINDNLKEITK